MNPASSRWPLRVEKKTPPRTDEEEDTVADTDCPKVCLSENTPTAQNNALSENHHQRIPGEIEEEDDYPPTPDARQSTPYETFREKEKDEEEDLERSLSALASGVDKMGEDEPKTDQSEEEADRHTKKNRPEYKTSRSSPGKRNIPRTTKQEQSTDPAGEGKTTPPNDANQRRLPIQKRSRLRERIRTSRPGHRIADLIINRRGKISSDNGAGRTGHAKRHHGNIEKKPDRAPRTDQKEQEQERIPNPDKKREKPIRQTTDATGKGEGGTSRSWEEAFTGAIKEKALQDKIHQDKEEEKQWKVREMQKERGRLEESR